MRGTAARTSESTWLRILAAWAGRPSSVWMAPRSSRESTAIIERARSPTDSALRTSRICVVIRAWFQKATAASGTMPWPSARTPLAWKARAADSRLR